jgi:hypothetical protein
MGAGGCSRVVCCGRWCSLAVSVTVCKRGRRGLLRWMLLTDMNAQAPSTLANLVAVRTQQTILPTVCQQQLVHIAVARLERCWHAQVRNRPMLIVAVGEEGLAEVRIVATIYLPRAHTPQHTPATIVCHQYCSTSITVCNRR